MSMPSISEAAEKLSSQGSRLEELEEKFQDIDRIETDATVKESFLSKEFSSSEPGTVAGIDGGLVKKRYSSGDVVAVRAVAAVFNYRDSLEVDYLPSSSPEPNFQVFEPSDSHSMDRNAETERVSAEIGRVHEALSKADTVLLDGSIVPSYLEDSEAVENYSEVFERAESGSFVGVVEDSYGLKLSKMLEDKLGIEIGDIRDTVLMDAILNEGERSFVRRYSTSPAEHPVLQELEDRHVNRIHTFYVKLSAKDLPLRVDFFGDVEEADRIAALLDSVKASKRYTVPAPILEADKRAKIPEKYLKRLEKRFSPEVRRRDRRAF